MARPPIATHTLILVVMATVVGCASDPAQPTSDGCAAIDCGVHGTCELVDSYPVCHCEPEYHPDGLACVADPDPCQAVTCSGHGACDASAGSPQCLCEPGYRADGLACIEDEASCQDVTCSGHGTCDANDGSPECRCESGYHADGLDCVADPVPATLLFDNGFESGDLQDWNCSGNCPSIAASPTSAGTYSGSFVLTRDLPNPYRTELVIATGLRFAYGEDYRMVLDYRYQDWATDSSAEIAPFQIHTTPSTWDDPACGTGSAYSTAPFLMFAQADQAKFITFGGNVLWQAEVELDEWLRIEVNFRISAGADGFIEAWKDGVWIGRVDGPNNAGVDGCGAPQREPYFKMGVYKWDWKDGRPATDSTRRQLFIDGVKIYRDDA